MSKSWRRSDEFTGVDGGRPTHSSATGLDRREDRRKDYGERRIICYGMSKGRLVVIGYTVRGAVRHVFSMRKANDREQSRLAPYWLANADGRATGENSGTSVERRR